MAREEIINLHYKAILKRHGLSVKNFIVKKIEGGFILHYPNSLFRYKKVKQNYSDRVFCWPDLTEGNGLKGDTYIFNAWLETFLVFVKNENFQDSDTEVAIRFLKEVLRFEKETKNEFVSVDKIFKALHISEKKDDKMVYALVRLDYLKAKWSNWSAKFVKVKLHFETEDTIKSIGKKGMHGFKENIEKPKSYEETSLDKEYQVGLSFSGTERGYVERVAQFLNSSGISVYYDEYEKTNMWGKDLYQHLSVVYSKKCNYCIVFLSSSYAERLWTKHELKSAQEQAFRDNKEYILPVRFDNTEIPGISSTISYIDATATSPEELGKMVIEKLKV
ncbi:MAG: TIR domain-containing protein [Cyclobacteriaceae bacterium]